MAMSVVIAENPNAKPISVIKFTWTAAADGSASGTTVNAYNGKCELLTTDPDTNAPTDNYDITILDENGVDVLGGAGLDRDTANTEQKLGDTTGAIASSKLTFTIANAGDSNQGVAYLHIRG